MPPVILALGAIAGAVVGTTTFWVVVAMVGMSFVSGEMARRKAQEAAQAARDAYNASLKDQYQTVRGTVSPANLIYGRTRVSGPVIYAESFGADNRGLFLVIGLARHQIDGFDSVYLDDKPVTLGVGGWATNTPWTQATNVQWCDTTSITVSAGAKTLPQTPYSDATHGAPTVDVLGVNVQGTFGNVIGSKRLTAGTDYTISTNQITFSSGVISAYAGKSTHICLNYAAATQSFVQVSMYSGGLRDDNLDDNTYWGKNYCTATLDGGVTDPSGGAIGRVYRITSTATGQNAFWGKWDLGQQMAGKWMRWGIRVKLGTYAGTFVLFLRDGADANVAYATFTLSGAGSVSGISGNATDKNAAILQLPQSGWYDIAVSGTFPSNATTGVKLYLDPVNSSTNGETYYVWGPRLNPPLQEADAVLVANSASKWTAAHRLNGCAYAILQLVYNRDVFPNGIPNVSFVVRGKRTYDPRKAVDYWTENPALCAREYLTSSPGFSVPGSAVDDTTVVAAANDCDSQIQITATPTYQTKYTCDGILPTGTDRATNLDSLVSSMAGAAYYSQGKWKMRSGAAVSQVLTLNENSLSSGAIQISPYVSRRDLFNQAKAKFLDASNAYAETDVPPWVSPTFLAADGGVAYPLQLSFPMVTDSIRCQRLSKIRVLQSRSAYTLALKCNLSMYQAAVGDGVTVTLARYGISAQAFRIIDRQINDKLQVVLTLIQDSASTYAWNLGEQTVLDASPSASLVDPRAVQVPTISGTATGDSTVLRNADGSTTARIRIDLAACTDALVNSGGSVELQFKTAYMADWQSLGQMNPGVTTIYIAPITPNLGYAVRVKYINSAGVSSLWAYANVLSSAATTAPAGPNTLTVSESAGALRLVAWLAASLDVDCDKFELRYCSGATGTWASMSLLDIVPIGTPATLAWAALEATPAAAGTYSFAVAAVRRDGSYSAPCYCLNVALAHAVGSIVAASIVDQLTASQIASLAFTQLTGTIAASQIAADTITAKHLAVSDFTNLAGNGDFSTGDLKNWCRVSGTVAVIAAAGAPAGCPTPYCVKLTYLNPESSLTAGDVNFDSDTTLQGGWAVKTGDPFYIQCDVASASSTRPCSLELITRKPDGTLSGGVVIVACGNADGAWHTYSATGTSNADGHMYLRFGCYTGSAQAGDVFYGTNLICQRRSGGNLIVDGAITAAKINVSNLAAIKADLGAITAGSISIGGKFGLAADGTLTVSGATVSGTVTASAVVADSVTTPGMSANAATQGTGISWSGSTALTGSWQWFVTSAALANYDANGCYGISGVIQLSAYSATSGYVKVRFRSLRNGSATVWTSPEIKCNVPGSGFGSTEYFEIPFAFTDAPGAGTFWYEIDGYLSGSSNASTDVETITGYVVVLKR